MTCAAMDGANLWFSDSDHDSDGDRRKGQQCVIWLPGGPGCCDYYASLIPMLPEDVRSIRYDPRGCGRSERKGPYTVSNALRDLECIRVATACTRWRLIGHSAGADLALAYALEYPLRTEAVLAIAGGRIHNDRQWHQVYSDRRDNEGELVPEQPYPYNAHVNECMNRSWKEYCKSPTLLQRLSQLSTPVHFLLGEQDIRPNWPLVQVANLIPNGTIKVISGAQHSIWMTHPKEFEAALRRFVDRAAGSRSA